MDNVVEVRGLTRRYKRITALDNFDLDVPRGGVLGLVGENGAGKTTVIKHVLGLLRAQTGSVRVFGIDPVKEPAKVLARIGTLSEDRDLPAWMCVWELMKYMSTFYPKWDAAYAEHLRDVFELPPKAKLGSLSQGQLAKAGLLAALAHRPEFLVLDEPSSGLDPNVRRNILESIVLTVTEEGRTVLFSSHLLDEVERVADRVAMVHKGRLVLSGAMDDVKENHHEVVVRTRNGHGEAPVLPGALACTGAGPEWTVFCSGSLENVRAAAAQADCDVVETRTPTLEAIFVGLSGKTKTSLEQNNG
ncbi:MAG: ABC transporter ATP-binding protein [Candidatus Hydrogenedentes bacterium]|nr:ABC transporter ATP-binding protein [Candidatus Hydrogenedentota bacterium]